MKYLFLDIDGTLYSSKINDTPESAREAIRLARENGSKVFLCTGRGLAECAEYLGYPVDGFVFAAGALIYVERKRIYDRPIPKPDIKQLKQLLHSFGMGYACEGMAGAYCDERGYEAVLNYFADRQLSREKKITSSMANGFYPEEYGHEDDPIYKICCYASEISTFHKMAEQLLQPYLCTLTVRDPIWHNHCSEITDGNITKSTGIARVLASYGSDYSQAVAIGDSGNDIPMIRDCGIGIAMGNAFDSVKQAADFTTTDILDDGIWNAFKKVGVI